MTTVIIGGGASGMMAAISSTALPDNHVVLLERSSRLGRKLSVTGNGRCNLTNLNLSIENYNGSAPQFVSTALSDFGVSDTLAFFKSIGLITVAEPSGRVYPHSDQAGSVVDVLRFRLADSGVDVRTDFEVTSAKQIGEKFTILSLDESLSCDRLIVTCGGIAGTKAGGCDSGYNILESFGHSRTRLYPALVQLKTDNAYTLPLKGVRADAAVSVICDGTAIAQSFGEVQFTDYGVSGPAIFEISRAAVTGGDGCTINLDLMRELPADELYELLLTRRRCDLTLENLLTGILHNKLGRTVLSRCGFSLALPVSRLSNDDLKRIVYTTKNYKLALRGNMGMAGAQVTAGGIRTDEFFPDTLESRIVPGLFAAGEVLDVDGDCGGYNLQWAWSSGHLAGRLGVGGAK